MKFQPDNIYHVFNQGNNQQVIFTTPEEYVIFLKMVRELIKPNCEIIAYCLMPNHFHFMLSTDNRCAQLMQQGGNTLDVLTNGFRKLLSGYARVFNQCNARSGSLFRPKTKAKTLTGEAVYQNILSPNEYYANCFHYIHLNPFVAGLVKRAEDWQYSSCRDYALLRQGTLINLEDAKRFCNYDDRFFLSEMYGRKDVKFEY